MNTTRNVGGKIGEAAAGANQVPPQALGAGMDMNVNPIALTDREVRKALVEMAQAINLQS